MTGVQTCALPILEFVPLTNLIATKLESTTVSSTVTSFVSGEADDDEIGRASCRERV